MLDADFGIAVFVLKPSTTSINRNGFTQQHKDMKMKLLSAIFVIFLLAGCGGAKYYVKIYPDGTVEAKAQSYREYAYFGLDVNPVTKLFTVKAIGVTDDRDEILKAAIDASGTFIPAYLIKE